VVARVLLRYHPLALMPDYYLQVGWEGIANVVLLLNCLLRNNHEQRQAQLLIHFELKPITIGTGALRALAIENERMIPQQASTVTNFDDIESYVRSLEPQNRRDVFVSDRSTEARPRTGDTGVELHGYHCGFAISRARRGMRRTHGSQF